MWQKLIMSAEKCFEFSIRNDKEMLFKVPRMMLARVVSNLSRLYLFEILPVVITHLLISFIAYHMHKVRCCCCCKEMKVNNDDELRRELIFLYCVEIKSGDKTWPHFLKWNFKMFFKTWLSTQTWNVINVSVIKMSLLKAPFKLWCLIIFVAFHLFRNVSSLIYYDKIISLWCTHNSKERTLVLSIVFLDINNSFRGRF
jgi:hypothetical protein